MCAGDFLEVYGGPNQAGKPFGKSAHQTGKVRAGRRLSKVVLGDALARPITDRLQKQSLLRSHFEPNPPSLVGPQSLPILGSNLLRLIWRIDPVPFAGFS